MPDLQRTASFCRKLAAKLNPARVRRGIVSAFVTNIRPLEHMEAAFDTLALTETDLGKMVRLPTSTGQFEGKIADIITKLELDGRCDLLEVGCGNGYVLMNLRHTVQTLVGADISDCQLRVARNLLPGCSFFRSRADNLPFADSTFDRVLCYSVFHHFPNGNYARKALNELCRVCKGDGIILIGDVPSKALRRKCVSRAWEFKYRLHVLLGRHDGPSLFNPLRWLFLDLQQLAGYARSLGHVPEILPQPATLIAADYRLDLKIRVRK